MLLLGPVRVDSVHAGQRVAWMGVEGGRNAFVRLVLLQDGAEIDKAFGGDAAQSVYAPLKALRVKAGVEVSVPIEGSLPAGEPTEGMSRGQLLLPCFPAASSVEEATVLDLGRSVGRSRQAGEDQPKRLPSSSVLVHSPLFPIQVGGI